MSGLFGLGWRDSRVISDVESICDGGNGSGDHKWRLRMRGKSDGFELGQHDYERLMAHPRQLLPAEPGIQALSIVFEDERPIIDKAPVIAWALCFDGSVRIVTPAGIDDGHMWKDGGGYVLMPNGSVWAVGEWLETYRFDSVDDYAREHAAKRGVKLEAVA